MISSTPITELKKNEGLKPPSERLKRLERAVVELYRAEKIGHEVWSPWLIDNHVMVVANYASELAKRYKANRELSRAAALLHDIADTVMARSSTAHGS